MSRNKIKFRHSFVSAQVFGLPSSTGPLGFPNTVYDNINQSETSSIDNAETERLENCTENLPETSISLPQPSFISLSNDPVFWPATISDAQRCDIFKRGPEQINITFPYNSAKRRFSSVHYERTIINAETIHRSWLLYSQQSDQILGFGCKVFVNTASPFCSGMNTWEDFLKNYKIMKIALFTKNALVYGCY